MPDFDPHERALVAGLVTSTLDDAETAEVRGLLQSDPDLAALVQEFEALFAAEDTDALSERVWSGLQRRLTEQKK